MGPFLLDGDFKRSFFLYFLRRHDLFPLTGQTLEDEGFVQKFCKNITHLQSELHQKTCSLQTAAGNSLTLQTTENDLRSVKQHYTFTHKYFKARLKHSDSSEEMFRLLSAQAQMTLGFTPTYKQNISRSRSQNRDWPEPWCLYVCVYACVHAWELTHCLVLSRHTPLRNAALFKKHITHFL